MYSYDLLETGCYYLVKEKEDSAIIMIKVAVGQIIVYSFNDMTNRSKPNGN